MDEEKLKFASKAFKNASFETTFVLTRQQILDSSKLKEFADDNVKFHENGKKLSKWVENTVGKGEIARDEQFLLFSQCFQKAHFPGASKGVIVWEWVKPDNLVVLGFEDGVGQPLLSSYVVTNDFDG